MTGVFDPKSAADVAELIAEYPLAWVVSRDFQATPLPLIAELDEEGGVLALIGHFALRNPQVAALRADPRALVLFQGPQGYIAPRLVSNPRWGPTWNYAVGRFTVDIAFQPDETDAAIARLIASVDPAWSTDAMGPRYAELRKHIIGFRAEVREEQATFKLGQDEAPGTFEEIVTGLGEGDLAHWMRAQR